MDLEYGVNTLHFQNCVRNVSPNCRKCHFRDSGLQHFLWVHAFGTPLGLCDAYTCTILICEDENIYSLQACDYEITAHSGIMW